VRKAANLPPSCAIVTKSGNLNFLEPSGPLQACNGTDFAFFLPICIRPTHLSKHFEVVPRFSKDLCTSASVCEKFFGEM